MNHGISRIEEKMWQAYKQKEGATPDLHGEKVGMIKAHYEDLFLAYHTSLKELAPMPRIEAIFPEKTETVSRVVEDVINYEGHECFMRVNLNINGARGMQGGTSFYFSITGEIYEGPKPNPKKLGKLGTIHGDIMAHMPELKDAVPFHLYGNSGPIHYFDNTRFYIQNGDLSSARDAANWSDATDDDLQLEGLYLRLYERLPKMHEEFINLMAKLQIPIDFEMGE